MKKMIVCSTLNTKSSGVFRLLGLILILILTLIANCQGPGLDLKDVVGIMSKKLDILSRMQINLLRSVGAEKNAVMADTDEESKTFADQSLKAADLVERDRREIGLLMDKDHSNQELKLLQEFDGCWVEFRKIDRELLDFAVKNTNLKAARLSFGPAGEAVNRFEKALDSLISIQTDSQADVRIPKLACRALTAGLKILYLQAPHIAAADDQRMDKIEASIKQYEQEINESLKTLKGLVPPGKEQAYQEAKAAFHELKQITAQVIDLSRQNTNIKSFEISLGRKRKISAQCSEILVSLEEAVKAREFKATR
jgi:hypothetical protein